MKEVGKLTGAIEGKEGIFQCMVYFSLDEKPLKDKPNGWIIGQARKIKEEK